VRGKTSEVSMRVVEFEPGRRIRFAKDNPFHIEFGFELEPSAAGTHVTYPVVLEPRGFFKLVLALMRPKNQIARDLANIKAAVERS
jgi:hypothetical protein